MERNWWKETVFYQIYPKSFNDTNNDGIGDLKGITEKLPYIKELGAGAIWICPCYRSPMYDQGYDISDYYSINPMFGTMEDMDELLAKAKELDLKVIMDLVLNHTSHEHKWFREACADRNSKYCDYYIFRDNIDGLAKIRDHFCGNAWTQIEDGRWYFHSFLKEQPDLNWDCKEMRRDLYDMINWWIDKGVGGFRIDAITCIKKDMSFPPVEPDGADGLYDVAKYSTNLPGIGEYLLDLKEHTYGRGEFVSVAEAAGVDPVYFKDYIGEENGYFSMMFDFSYQEIDLDRGMLWAEKKDWTVDDFKEVLFKEQKITSEAGWATAYLENHDRPRSIDTFFPGQDVKTNRVKMAKVLASMYFLLRGTPFIFEGQEIGMINDLFTTIDQLDDVNSLGQYDLALKEGYTPEQALAGVNRRSRDQSRLPMQWNSGKNGGFSDADPWLSCNKTCPEITVESQLDDPDSVLNYYKELIRLRTKSEYSEILTYGDFVPVDTTGTDVVLYQRVLDDEKIYVAANMGPAAAELAVPAPAADTKLIGNFDDLPEGSGAGFTIRPYEAVVWRG